MRTRRGESLVNTLVILAIIGVGLYMVFPSYFTWLPTSESVMGHKITMVYEDGTERSLSSFNPLDVLLGGQLVDPTTGKVITKIVVDTAVKPVWTGTMSSTLLSGTAEAMMGTVVKQTDSIPNYTGGFVSGSAAAVKSVTYTSATISAWDPTPGSKTVTFYSAVSLTVNFADASTDSKSGEASTSVTYTYAAWGLTSVTVTVTPTKTLV